MSHTHDELASCVRVCFIGADLSANEHSQAVDAVYQYAHQYDLDLLTICKHHPHVTIPGEKCTECNYFRVLENVGLRAGYGAHAVVPETTKMVLDIVEDAQSQAKDAL
jgi:hypothetical protein